MGHARSSEPVATREAGRVARPLLLSFASREASARPLLAALLALGSIEADADGHFETTLVLPASVPEGYGQLIATSADVGEVRTWVRIGAPLPGQAPTRGAGQANALLSDPSVLVLGALVASAILVLGYLLVRPRPRTSRVGHGARVRTPRKRRPVGRS